MRGECPVGAVYGRLTVLERDLNTRSKGVIWRCECTCGTTKSYHANNLRKGYTQSCGCLQKELQSQRQLIDRVGEIHSRLKVVSRAGFIGEQASWVCQCSCGNTVVVAAGELSSGGTKSCGCLQRQRAAESSRTHGLANSKEYRSWSAMKSRCTNPKRDNYKYYGGRGITVCERWLNSFEDFYADMGPIPSNQHSIEREDHNGNYEPNNCVWATQSEQMRNTSKSKMVDWQGKRITMIELSEVTGTDYTLLQSRLSKGWSINDAVHRPLRAKTSFS